MAKVLSTGNAYDGAVAWLLSDGSGRNIQVQVVDTATFTPSWASVLAVGNTSGGTDVIVSSTDELQFARTPGNAPVRYADGLMFSQGVSDVLLLDTAVRPQANLVIPGTVELQFDITPGTALVRVADAVRIVANGTDAAFLNDTTLRIESGVELELDTNPGPAVIRGTDAISFYDAAVLVLELNNTSVESSVPNIQWSAASTSPFLTQVTQTAGNGRTMTIRSQAGEAGVGNGGTLLLTSGTGVASGNVTIRPGSGSGSNGSVLIQQAAGPTTGILVSASGLAFWGGTPSVRPSVTGSRGGNAALASLLTVLDTMGLITNNTTA